MKFVKKAAAALFGALAIAGAAQAQDITVQYNGKTLDFTDAQPAIVEQRVMVPFRSVFEQMGAQVDYDEETRIASADFNGNGIFFSIDGADIHSSTMLDNPVIYTMDVPPVIENDRVLVPIRALSEAGGLLVGWDQEESTVNILDPVPLVDDVLAAAPDMAKLMELRFSDVQPNLYQGNLKVLDDGVDFNLGFKAWGANDLVQLRFDIAAVDGTDPINFSLELIAGDGYNLYIKTDALKELADHYPNDFELNLAATVFSADSWYKYDLEEDMYFFEDLMSAIDSADADYVKKEIEDGIADNLYTTMLIDVDLDSAAQCRDIAAIVNSVAEEIDGDYLTVDLKSENTADIIYTVTGRGSVFDVRVAIEDGCLTYIGCNYESGDELYNLALTGTFADVDAIVIPENAMELNGVIDSIAW